MTTSVSVCRRRARTPLAVAFAVLLSAPGLAAQQGPWEIPMGPMGAPRRALLGVGISTEQPSEYDARGARVGDVDPESGAAEAGLEAGDVIVRVDGRSLVEPLDPAVEEALDEGQSLPVQRLLALLADRDPGEEIEVEYVRDGATRTASVELQPPRRFFADRDVVIDAPYAAPFAGPGAGPRGQVLALSRFRDIDACPAPQAGRGPGFAFGRSCAAGADLIELNAGLAEYFRADAGDVLVTDVAAENPLGLAAGDVIVAVGGRDVRGLAHALGMLRSYEDDEQVQVRVIRKGQTTELVGTLR